jgi:hypothetical protein
MNHTPISVHSITETELIFSVAERQIDGMPDSARPTSRP